MSDKIKQGDQIAKWQQRYPSALKLKGANIIVTYFNDSRKLCQKEDKIKPWELELNFCMIIIFNKNGRS